MPGQTFLRHARVPLTVVTALLLAVLPAGAQQADSVPLTLQAAVAAAPLGAGAEQRAPMARAVIGGLITSTLLTLLVVPVVYTLLEDSIDYVRTNAPDRLRQVRRSLTRKPQRTAKLPATS